MIETRLALLDAILSDWRETIGADYAGYRNHVYRLVNFASALRACGPDEHRKLIIAGCFHDLGIWSHRTVDYLPPSLALAHAYLDDHALSHWQTEIAAMIAFHHQVRPHHDEAHPLVEVFRRADLVDVSLGLVTFELRRPFVRRVRAQFPNAGFHARLARVAATGLVTRPRRPLPFFKW